MDDVTATTDPTPPTRAKLWKDTLIVSGLGTLFCVALVYGFSTRDDVPVGRWLLGYRLIAAATTYPIFVGVCWVLIYLKKTAWILLVTVMMAGLIVLGICSVVPPKIAACADLGPYADYQHGECVNTYDGNLVLRNYTIRGFEDTQHLENGTPTKHTTYTVDTPDNNGTTTVVTDHLSTQILEGEYQGKNILIRKSKDGVSHLLMLEHHHLTGPMDNTRPIQEGFCYQGWLYRLNYTKYSFVDNSYSKVAERTGSCPDNVNYARLDDNSQ
jgi:hypothetical protein